LTDREKEHVTATEWRTHNMEGKGNGNGVLCSTPIFLRILLTRSVPRCRVDVAEEDAGQGEGDDEADQRYDAKGESCVGQTRHSGRHRYDDQNDRQNVKDESDEVGMEDPTALALGPGVVDGPVDLAGNDEGQHAPDDEARESDVAEERYGPRDQPENEGQRIENDDRDR